MEQQVYWNTDRITAQLKRWQERLLDLSKANPLLGINRSRVSRLRVLQPSADVVFRDLVLEGRSLRMPFVAKVLPGSQSGTEGDTESEYRVKPGDLTFEATPTDLYRKLRRIYDNARTSVEERGVTTLHLSFGVLKWEDPALGVSISPLWLVPCRLESFGPSAQMELSIADEEMQINPVLKLYLRERHRVSLPELPDDLKPEILGAFFKEVTERVRDHGWRVEGDVWLSTYSFESLVLYQDLKAMNDAALRNRIVAALARATPLGEASESLGEDALDGAPTPEQVPIPVLRTDSSQLRALTMARMGHHLVVHGPPGTGKSQTIANLIADALGQGKTVLFVSAKMAALEVVYRRLKQLGLDRFCLEVHSTKAGKARIIDELRRTLAAAEQRAIADRLDEHLEDFLRTREELNTYVRGLHERRRPLDLSLYEAIGWAERRRREPDVRGPLPWKNVLAVSRSELGAALDALDALGSQAEVFDNRASHPWRGLVVQPSIPVQRELIESDLMAILEAGQTLQPHLARLEVLLGSTASLSFDDLGRLAGVLAEVSKIGRLPQGWSTRKPDDLEATATLLGEAAVRAEEQASKLAAYHAAWKIPPADVLQLLEPAESEFTSPLRVLRPTYWRWRRNVRMRLHPAEPSDLETLRVWLATVRRLMEIRSWFEQHGGRIATEIGTDHVFDAALLREAAHEAHVATRLQAVLASAKVVPPEAPAPLSADLQHAAGEIAALFSRCDWQEALDRVDAAWPGGFVDGASARVASLAATLARCHEVLTASERLHEWIGLQRTLDRCKELGLTGFVDNLGSVSARRATAAFEKRFYKAWVNAVLQASPDLATFTGLHREQLIKKFRQLDEQLRTASLAHVREEASKRAFLVANARSDLGTSSEVGVLRRELQKQKRFKPLRKLFAEIPNVLQALKPCMLMSPLSVSTFLTPGTIKFDLVVFDEASQLPTPEGIPAILRAEQVVVAGDSKQLPPTSFFTASVIFDDDDGEPDATEDLEPLESLLDDCVAIYPVFNQTHLRWHYRSRDERLIAFSNHYFYREKPLITFPSVFTGDEDRGVRLVYVEDGVWDRGGSRTNRPEARRVVDLIIEHAERWPQRSLGVVAMNMAQREAIEELLDEQFLERPDLRERLRAHTEEPFFIKALENVQGDERDTIIISVGYGRTASGAMSYNFGPLNQDGGWRRLNVLVTRARWQTILVTSMRADDLRYVNPNNRGAVALRNFIEYAERGARLPPERPGVTQAETNDFEDAVAEELRSRGYDVDQQVGVSEYRIDLAIRDPRDPCRYLLGIECDGATYHSAKTARDRDLLREQVLKELGWRLYRIWSTDWFRDRERAIEAAVRAIEQALHAPVEQSVIASPVSGAAQEAPRLTAIRPKKPPAASQRYPAGAPYRKYREAGAREILLDEAKRRDLTDQIVRIVTVEGPIHGELLVERLKEINSVGRVGKNVAGNIERAVRRALQRGELERVDKDFLRRPDQRLTTFRTPGDGVQRLAAWVPMEEIQLAVLHIVEDQFGCQRNALPKAVADLFGFDRTPVGLGERVATAVDVLIDEGQLQASGPNVYLA